MAADYPVAGQPEDTGGRSDGATGRPDAETRPVAPSPARPVPDIAPPPDRPVAPSPFGQTPDFLLDVRLTVSVEVGRIQLPVRQVLELAPGAVLELQRSASEPVDVYANGRCIGRGEIVVVGDQFGVRITELGSSD